MSCEVCQAVSSVRSSRADLPTDALSQARCLWAPSESPDSLHPQHPVLLLDSLIVRETKGSLAQPGVQTAPPPPNVLWGRHSPPNPPAPAPGALGAVSLAGVTAPPPRLTARRCLPETAIWGKGREKQHFSQPPASPLRTGIIPKGSFGGPLRKRSSAFCLFPPRRI